MAEEAEMFIEFHDRLNRLIRLPVSRVLVVDKFGTPCSLSYVYAPRHTRHFHMGDPDFKQQLAALGINHVFDVTIIDTDKLGK